MRTGLLAALPLRHLLPGTPTPNPNPKPPPNPNPNLCVIYHQESRGAAITVQAAFRGTKSRQDISQKADAAAKMQARMRGNFTREVTDYELVEFRAAAALQAVWRRHLACGMVCKLRWERRGKLKRTFSWSRQKMHCDCLLRLLTMTAYYDCIL